MKYSNHILKIFLLILIINVYGIGFTNASFSDSEKLIGNKVTAGCWASPSVPELVYPEDGSYNTKSSGWNENPYMDWEASEKRCPQEHTITYYYQSCYDEDCNLNAYKSDALTNTKIPAPNTPEGTYYWRVKACASYDECSEWSDVWKFTVDRTTPFVEITDPDNMENVSGEVDIKGSISDPNIKSYKLLIKDKEGNSVYDSGFINVDEHDDLTDRVFYTWDTSGIEEGKYHIWLFARDHSDNESNDKVTVKVVKEENNNYENEDDEDSSSNKGTDDKNENQDNNDGKSEENNLTTNTDDKTNEQDLTLTTTEGEDPVDETPSESEDDEDDKDDDTSSDNDTSSPEENSDQPDRNKEEEEENDDNDSNEDEDEDKEESDEVEDTAEEETEE